MTSRDRDRFRKYESGSNKRARQQQRDDFIKKQTGSSINILSQGQLHLKKILHLF